MSRQPPPATAIQNQTGTPGRYPVSRLSKRPCAMFALPSGRVALGCTARAIWTGAVAFGLVNVPIRLVAAVSEQTLRFHLAHAPDAGPIGYEKICKLEGGPVPDEEIVKAFELENGELVYLTDEDFEAAEAERRKTIELSEFVPLEEIDPVYFARTYYAAPQEGSEKVYELFVRALEESGLAAVGTLVLREREHLVALRVRDGVVAVELLYFADEVQPPGDLKPEQVDVAKPELEMALQLIEHFSTSFEPERYRDSYREALLAVIEQKREGKEVRPAPPPEQAPEAPDLMSALRASVEEAKRRRGRSAPAGRRPSRARAGRRKASPPRRR